MQLECECAVQRRQLVSGSCHRLHELFRGHFFSGRFDCFDCMRSLRRGSILCIGRRVHSVCFRLLLRFGRNKLHGLCFG